MDTDRIVLSSLSGVFFFLAIILCFIRRQQESVFIQELIQQSNNSRPIIVTTVHPNGATTSHQLLVDPNQPLQRGQHVYIMLQQPLYPSGIPSWNHWQNVHRQAGSNPQVPQIQESSQSSVQNPNSQSTTTTPTPDNKS